MPTPPPTPVLLQREFSMWPELRTTDPANTSFPAEETEGQRSGSRKVTSPSPPFGTWILRPTVSLADASPQTRAAQTEGKTRPGSLDFQPGGQSSIATPQILVSTSWVQGTVGRESGGPRVVGGRDAPIVEPFQCLTGDDINRIRPTSFSAWVWRMVGLIP